MKYAAYAVGAVVVLVLALAATGFCIPRTHVAASRIRVNATPTAVFQLLEDRRGATSWRADLTSVEILPDHDGHPVFRETGSVGPMTLEVVLAEPPRKMITQIADPDLPFGGRWIYEIAPDGDGAVVTITEEGEIKNPVFRTMARFVFGYHGAELQYLRALGKKLGADGPPEKVR
ncbi:MAG: SRPBCC family protein [Acidobacteriota bacterium]